MNLLLAAFGTVLAVSWIIALANSDGECHFDDCWHCPYSGNCPWERKRG